MIRVRLLQPTAEARAGAIIEVTDACACAMLQAKQAELVDDPPVKATPATANKAIRRPPRDK